MKKVILAIAVTLLAAPLALSQRRGSQSAPSSQENPPVPKSDFERKVLNTLDEIVRSGALYANVPAPDGRMLRILTESANAKNVVEIGTSTGISGLWFALALAKTGGKLTTFEYDKSRAATARKHFQQAGAESMVQIVEGDAHQTISRLKDPIDVVFIDADKEGYVDYLNKLLPLVRPGGLLLAHNVNMIPDYMKKVTSSPDLDTVVYSDGGGLAITLKKR
jgi:predicted O-methyltransferase YrrM